jgi:hypothetical protein
MIVTPFSPGGIDERTGLPMTAGGYQVNVVCDYWQADGDRLRVAVMYALPTDPNPHSDFFFGCSSGGVKWTDADRKFQLASEKQWAIASFYDYLSSIGASDVPAFEGVARQLLQNSEGYAHDCTLKTAETPTLFNFQYSFSGPAGAGKVQFNTFAALISSGALPVVSTSTPTYKLKLNKRQITVKVRNGVRYYPALYPQRPKLELAVQVVASQLPGCASGNTGTLVLTTSSLRLRVCSKSFDGGKTNGHIANA